MCLPHRKSTISVKFPSTDNSVPWGLQILEKKALNGLDPCISSWQNLESFSRASPWHLAEVPPQEHHACPGVGVDLVELRLHLPHHPHSSHGRISQGGLSVRFHPSLRTFPCYKKMKLKHWSIVNFFQAPQWSCCIDINIDILLGHQHITGCQLDMSLRVWFYHVLCAASSGQGPSSSATRRKLPSHLTCINSAGTLSSCRSSSTSAQQLPGNSNF